MKKIEDKWVGIVGEVTEKTYYEKQCDKCESLNVDVPEIGHGKYEDRPCFYTEYKCKDCGQNWTNFEFKDNGEEKSVEWIG